jgi:hypothetical protein
LIVACDITFAFASPIGDEAGRAAYCTTPLKAAAMQSNGHWGGCAKLSRLESKQSGKRKQTKRRMYA